MKRDSALSAAHLLMFCALCLLACAMAPAGAHAAKENKATPLAWTVLEPGLELGLAALPESLAGRTRAMFVALRIDPERHAFRLCMASESGKPLSLVEWSRRDDLRAGINASMYLPDMTTSTGYMRSGGAVNNSNMGGRLGAFFVAGPEKDGSPRADIIEKDLPGWRERLDAYSLVVQNYRLVSAGKLLWPEGGPMHSIAAVSKDDRGRIIFILCQESLSVGRFAGALAELFPGLDPVMYVEGGAQAGLFVRLDADGPALPGATAHAVAGGMIHVWKGRQSLLNTRGNPDAPLPNVIGVPMKAGR